MSNPVQNQYEKILALKPRALKMLVTLKAISLEHNSPVFRVKTEEIQRKSGFSSATATQAMKEIEKAGFICRKTGKEEKIGIDRTIQYTINTQDCSAI